MNAPRARLPGPERFKAWLKRRFALRVHMFFLLLAAVAGTLLFSRLLLWLGPSWLPLRYALIAAFGYCAFLLLVRLWLYHFVEHLRRPDEGHPDEGHPDDGARVADALEAGIDAATPDVFDAARATPSPGVVWRASVDAGGVDGEGAVLVVVVAIVAAIVLASGVSLVVEAPVILSEAAIQIALSAGLARSVGGLEREGWLSSVVGRTWWMAALVVLAAISMGLAVEHSCPGARTVFEALRVAPEGEPGSAERAESPFEHLEAL